MDELTAEESEPLLGLPHVTTLPLLFKAANAFWFEYISTTLVNVTVLESPPYELLPQVITVPSVFNADIAFVFIYNFVTPDDKLPATLPTAPLAHFCCAAPLELSPHVTTLPPVRNAAIA